ncbi:MAG: hypothetical protein KAT71_08130 [Gammaproteobacteria bacterium]|nr:hypothetical protein [Gammaproteobacteria bacterium]
MSIYGKEFVKDYQDMIESFRSFQRNRDVVRSKLASIRDELTTEEYAILQARITMDITVPPVSMRRIADALMRNGVKDTIVTRQRVEQVLSKVLKRLEYGGSRC